MECLGVLQPPAAPHRAPELPWSLLYPELLIQGKWITFFFSYMQDLNHSADKNKLTLVSGMFLRGSRKLSPAPLLCRFIEQSSRRYWSLNFRFNCLVIYSAYCEDSGAPEALVVACVSGTWAWLLRNRHLWQHITCQVETGLSVS